MHISQYSTTACVYVVFMVIIDNIISIILNFIKYYIIEGKLRFNMWLNDDITIDIVSVSTGHI